MIEVIEQKLSLEINDGQTTVEILTDSVKEIEIVQAGIQGARGIDGADGLNGNDGQGVPTGGTAGQVLAKIDGDDFNTEWIDQSSGTQNVFVQDTAPSATGAYLWINTSGGNLQFLVEDGVA